VPEDNIRRFHYIKSSIGSYTYTALCHLACLKEEYAENSKKMEKYKGGHVIEASVKEAHGKILSIDFASLYPHLFIQCNLYSPVKNDVPGWSGNNFFKINGRYDNTRQGKLETLLKMLLKKRFEYKKANDPRQLALKIVLNTAYGITGSSNFLQVHHEHNAEDCTIIGVACIKYVEKRFNDEGFSVVYGDTDSVFVVVPPGKDEEVGVLKDVIVRELQSYMPFPCDSWKLVVESEFKHVWFFGKKNYVCITSDDKIVIKGLPIIKSDVSLLGAKILEVLKPLIIERQSIKFDKDFIDGLVDAEIRKDVSVVGRLYSVKSLDSYKSTSSLQFQIASRFGEGDYFLIPNKCLGGVGKVKRYCSVDEACGLSFSDLLLGKVYSELAPFVNKKEKYLNQLTLLTK